VYILTNQSSKTGWGEGDGYHASENGNCIKICGQEIRNEEEQEEEEKEKRNHFEK
jgi:hypothetical protein